MDEFQDGSLKTGRERCDQDGRLAGVKSQSGDALNCTGVDGESCCFGSTFKDATPYATHRAGQLTHRGDRKDSYRITSHQVDLLKTEVAQHQQSGSNLDVRVCSSPQACLSMLLSHRRAENRYLYVSCPSLGIQAGLLQSDGAGRDAIR